jgi:TolB-like protein/tetratricopeptide (TPR) repeat protein/class 3 adenylate cyclase
MADEEKTNHPRLEIAHVLFMDIVGYSKLLTDEQSEALQELNQIVRNTEAARQAEAAGELTILPTGDGMALVFTGSVEEPAECALEISQALRAQPTLPVRMGIHSGPVHQVKDANQRDNIAGVGINIAQRVMDCGDAGHILVSKRVADDLAQKRRWQPYLHELGDVEVKHGVVVSLVNLYAETIGNPTPPARIGKVRGRTPSSRVGTRKTLSPLTREIFAVAILLLALAIVSVIFAPAIMRSLGKGQVASPPQIPAIPSPPSLGDAIKGELSKKVTDALKEALSANKKTEPASNEATKHITSLAVLPFKNYSGEPNQEYFADGITDLLTTELSSIGAVTVKSHQSALKFKNSTKSAPEIGQELDADAIVEGSVLRDGNEVTVNVQLIEARTDRHLWAKKFERDVTNIFKMRNEVVEAIAHEIQAKISPEQSSRLSQAPAANPEALREYLLGRESWFKQTERSFTEALEHFNRAKEIDPGFALAWAGTADLYQSAADAIMPPKEAGAKAKAAVQRALELDDSLAEAHAALGSVYFTTEFRWADAEKELERAIQLKPNYAPAHWQYGWLLVFVGRLDEAINEYQRAVDLDPLNAVMTTDLNVPYTLKKDYDKGITQCHKALELDPNFYLPHLVLGWIEVERGANYPKALEEFRIAQSMETQPILTAYIGYVYGRNGQKDKALEILQELNQLASRRFVSPFCQAVVYLGLRDDNKTMDWLEKAYDSRSIWMGWLKVEPLYDPLRSNPRFQALYQKMNFPP